MNLSDEESSAAGAGAFNGKKDSESFFLRLGDLVLNVYVCVGGEGSVRIVCVCVCMCVCSECVHVCVCVCVHVCMYRSVCLCECVCMHTVSVCKCE